MAVTDTDIKRKLSIDTSPGNSTAQGNVNDSLGGYMSSTEITNATLHNLFDLVSGAENAASESEYRLIFLHNSAAQTLFGVKVWIQSQTTGGASVQIGLATQGVVSATQAGTRQASRIADENTAPSPAVTFSTANGSANALTVGDMAAGTVIGIWVRRDAANSAALDTDGAVLNYSGDTAA